MRRSFSPPPPPPPSPYSPSIHLGGLQKPQIRIRSLSSEIAEGWFPLREIQFRFKAKLATPSLSIPLLRFVCRFHSKTLLAVSIVRRRPKPAMPSVNQNVSATLFFSPLSIYAFHSTLRSLLILVRQMLGSSSLVRSTKVKQNVKYRNKHFFKLSEMETVPT